MLKKSTYIFLSLLLCVPIFFIIYFSLSIDTEIPTGSTLTRVEAKNPDGYTYSYSDREELDLYISAVSRGQKIEHPVRDISADEPTVIIYEELDSSKEYQFFMSRDTKECYYSDGNGTYFRIDEDDAKKLSLCDEFAFMYDNYSVPTITVSHRNGGQVVSPEEGFEWKYKKGEDFTDGLGLVEAPEAKTILFGSDDTLSLSFSVEPTSYELTVLRDGETVHFGSLDELPGKLSYSEDTPLDCEIKAQWLAVDDSTYYGSATYRMSLLFDIPATYSVVDKALSPGEFTIIHYKNLNDDQTVRIISDIPLPETQVHNNGGKKFSFLPIDVTAKPGKYAIKVIMGEQESAFTFDVRGTKTFDTISISQKHPQATDAGKAEFDALMKTLTAASVDERLWDDAKASGGTYKFRNPVKGATASDVGFGFEIMADTNLVGSTPYRQTGLDLEASVGTAVVATASGKVVYSGELSYSGKTVVIDHGFDVLSVYQNLAKTTVSVGDTVSIGDELGTVGKTGYTFKTRTKFSVMMEGVYINPVSNYTYGIQVS